MYHLGLLGILRVWDCRDLKKKMNVQTDSQQTAEGVGLYRWGDNWNFSVQYRPAALYLLRPHGPT